MSTPTATTPYPTVMLTSHRTVERFTPTKPHNSLCTPTATISYPTVRLTSPRTVERLTHSKQHSSMCTPTIPYPRVSLTSPRTVERLTTSILEALYCIKARRLRSSLTFDLYPSVVRRSGRNVIQPDRLNYIKLGG